MVTCRLWMLTFPSTTAIVRYFVYVISCCLLKETVSVMHISWSYPTCFRWYLINSWYMMYISHGVVNDTIIRNKSGQAVIYICTPHPFSFSWQISIQLEYPPNRSCPFICIIKQVPNFQCFLRGFLPSFFGKNVLISIQHRLLIFSPGGWPWGTRHRTLDAHGLQSHFRMDGRATAWKPNLPTKPPNCLAKKSIHQTSWFQNDRY